MPQSSTTLPLQLLGSGQILAIAPDCPGSLILLKPFYAEFVGPGAAVGGSFDVQCQSIYTIGSVQFVEPASCSERKQAFQRRIEYLQALQEILLEDAPLSRAAKLYQKLCEWVGIEQTQAIPARTACRLIGVMPHNIEIAWQSRPAALESTPATAAVSVVSVE